MADVTYDNAKKGSGLSLFGQTHFTFNYTMGSVSNGGLLVYVYDTSSTSLGGASAVTSVLAGGNSMTLIETYSAANAAVYFLANPPSGSITIQINTNAIYQTVNYYVESFANANQSTPTNYANHSNSGSSTSITSSLTTLTNRSYISAVFFNDTGVGQAMNAGTGFYGQTSGANGDIGGDSGGIVTPAGSYSMTVYINGGNLELDSIMIEIPPVASAATTPTRSVRGVGRNRSNKGR